MKPYVLILFLCCACLAQTPRGPVRASADGSAGTVANAALDQLCREAWENLLRFDPIFATRQNDPRYHDRVPDVSSAGLRRRERAQQNLLERARALDPLALTQEERLTRDLLVEELANELAVLALDEQEWAVDPLEGPQNWFPSLAPDQPIGTAGERVQLVRRWRAMAEHVRQTTANLRAGKAKGKVASKKAMEKVVAQLDALLATPIFDSPLVAPALGGGTWVPLARGQTVSAAAHQYLGASRMQRDLRLVNLHLQDGDEIALGTRILLPASGDPLPSEERGRFLNDVLTAVEREVYPAFASYREFLAQELLPVARGDDRPGLRHVPGGAAAYRVLIGNHTSLDLGPEEIHAIGLEEVSSVRAEIQALGQKLFGTSDVPAIQARLRDDPAMHFANEAEIEAKAKSALARAEAAVPAVFGRLPNARCIVVPVPAHEAKDTTVAYYREPAADGTRPGRYFVNTYAPTTRTRYEAEVLAYHEAVPGHHLQISIAQELTDLPRFRRHTGSTAFVEGWALYTERLCDELGLYTSDQDRMGMLSYRAWRACRLVVDTGLHALGWTRQQAIDYMLDNTLLAPNNVENEIDRYIAWPGQALAYKLGEREILALRREAQTEQGGDFSLAEFHDRVLENGAVTLGVLRERITTWLGAAEHGRVQG